MGGFYIWYQFGLQNEFQTILDWAREILSQQQIIVQIFVLHKNIDTFQYTNALLGTFNDFYILNLLYQKRRNKLHLNILNNEQRRMRKISINFNTTNQQASSSNRAKNEQSPSELGKLSAKL